MTDSDRSAASRAPAKPSRHTAHAVSASRAVRPAAPDQRISTGIPGLDELLKGGLPARRAYLVRGGPGTGKTTLGLHFLRAGARAGEAALLISLGEPEEQMRSDARGAGFDLRGIDILDLSPTPEFFTRGESYDIFAPAEVEREPMTRRIIERIEALKPARVFVDALTQFRYLAADDQQFRRQVLSFLRYVVGQDCTLMFTSETSALAPDEDLQFLADGVISIRFEASRRELWVSKLRGSDFQAGQHALRLTDHGIEVYPELVPAAHHRPFRPSLLNSGVAELDRLLGGGLERGTVNLITGPCGVGKTTLGLQFLCAAANRGQRALLYSFEEALDTLLRRCTAIGMPLQALLRQERLRVVTPEAMGESADELACAVRREVEERDARLVMIDSTAGYRLAMGGADPTACLHLLCRYLKNMGVTVILVDEISWASDGFRSTDRDLSFLADNVLFLRYLESGSQLRRAMGVLKKRSGEFEQGLREFLITSQGLELGAPLRLRGGPLIGEPDDAPGPPP